MALTSEQQVANTRVKLARLETRYEALRSETNGNPRVRELSMRSLKRLVSSSVNCSVSQWVQTHQTLK
jgi:hypothetical protein